LDGVQHERLLTILACADDFSRGEDQLDGLIQAELLTVDDYIVLRGIGYIHTEVVLNELGSLLFEHFHGSSSLLGR
jgi:hypothetical protein